MRNGVRVDLTIGRLNVAPSWTYGKGNQDSMETLRRMAISHQLGDIGDR